ncbi:MAG: hypothetical protein IE927_05980 [Rhodobacterales bacterium]|nr:hypothetical protein [Rhodobacterales bacterium]
MTRTVAHTRPQAGLDLARIGTALRDFFTVVAAAIDASRAIEDGKRPSDAALRQLGINPASFTAVR